MPDNKHELNTYKDSSVKLDISIDKDSSVQGTVEIQRFKKL